VLTAENAARIWTAALGRMSGMVVEQAKEFDRVTLSPPNRLVVSFKPRLAFAKSICDRPEQAPRFEQALTEVTGQAVSVSFVVEEDEAAGVAQPGGDQPRPVSPRQRLLEVARHPMIRRAGELFGAQPMRLDEPSNQEY
jgi:hypothetical protein